MAEQLKIPVGQYVREMEAALRYDGDPIRRAGILAVLRRWQFDEMLDDASRRKAKVLVSEFVRNGALIAANRS